MVRRCAVRHAKAEPYIAHLRRPFHHGPSSRISRADRHRRTFRSQAPADGDSGRSAIRRLRLWRRPNRACAERAPRSRRSRRSPVDTAALQTLTDAFLSTWNAHDAAGFTNLFTIDTQFTNPYGVFVSGRNALAAFNTKIFATVFSASTQSFLAVVPQPLAPGLTSADVRWSMIGATVPNWPPTQYGLISWVLQKQTDGSLQIAIMHNTIVPPPA